MYSIQIAGFSAFIFTLQRRGEIRNPADYVRGEAGGVGGMGGRVAEWANGQAHHPSMAFAARTAASALGECF